MIKRLLVANRGEIAVRILATAAVLDVPTVAVYPADDASCAHVAQADEAVLLPGTGAAAYLDAVAGGGRGMRPVTREQDLAEAMHRCASEAAASFGDGSLYVERLLAPARHVEVQVIGDGTGAIAVLGDRDCSIQRRRQKLIEIAPAALDEHLRGRLAETAVALVGSTPYAGLATVERTMTSGSCGTWCRRTGGGATTSVR